MNSFGKERRWNIQGRWKVFSCYFDPTDLDVYSSYARTQAIQVVVIILTKYTTRLKQAKAYNLSDA